jgi:hypothetical protein
MVRLVMLAIDLLAVSVLVFGLYFPRHRRRDLVVAYLGVNVGVLAVAGLLAAVLAALRRDLPHAPWQRTLRRHFDPPLGHPSR